MAGISEGFSSELADCDYAGQAPNVKDANSLWAVLESGHSQSK